MKFAFSLHFQRALSEEKCLLLCVLMIYLKKSFIQIRRFKNYILIISNLLLSGKKGFSLEELYELWMHSY